MKMKLLTCVATVVALAVSPAMAAKKMKKSGHHHHHHHHSMRGGVVGGAVGTAGAIAGGAVATAGAIATAPIMMAPVSAINGPTCKRGTWVTINGKKMRCQ